MLVIVVLVAYGKEIGKGFSDFRKREAYENAWPGLKMLFYSFIFELLLFLFQNIVRFLHFAAPVPMLTLSLCLGINCNWMIAVTAIKLTCPSTAKAKWF